MCGRFYNHLPAMHAWVDILKDWPGELTPGYNIAPTATIPVLTQRGVQPARWGLIPAWAKEFKSAYNTFNARVESVATKPTFRNAWKNSQTCIIPAGGYYEWKAENGVKQPYLVHNPDDGVLVFAGLMEAWEDRLSCTVLTEESKGSLKELHHRMPVMLNREDALHWLNSKIEAAPTTSVQELEYFAVTTRVNSARNNDSGLIEPQ